MGTVFRSAALAALVLAFAATGAEAHRGSAAGRPSAAANAERQPPPRASRVIGMDVVNRQGQKIGDIEDIVLSRRGEPAYALVSTGTFLGVGERLHAVPWRSLDASAGSDRFILDIDRERLSQVPAVDLARLPDPDDRNWVRGNVRHYPATPTRAPTTPKAVGRPPVNDIGPTGATTGRTGNAAGAGAMTATGTDAVPAPGSAAVGAPPGDARRPQRADNQAANPPLNPPGSPGNPANPAAGGLAPPASGSTGLK